MRAFLDDLLCSLVRYSLHQGTPTTGCMEAGRRRQLRLLEAERETAERNLQRLLASPEYSPKLHAHLDNIVQDRIRRIAELHSSECPQPSILTDAQMDAVKSFAPNLRVGWHLLSGELQREFVARFALDRVLIKHDKAHIWCWVIWIDGHVDEILIHRPYIDERTPWC